jgi:hypothetical protein
MTHCGYCGTPLMEHLDRRGAWQAWVESIAATLIERSRRGAR